MATEVDPGNIELFGKRMIELAEYWADPNGHPMDILSAERNGNVFFPEGGGSTTEGDAWANTYNGKRNQLRETFGALYTLLHTFGEGSKKVAEKYRNAAELSDAKIGQIDAILAEEMGQGGVPGQTPPGGTRPPAPAA
jgi:hypothetical protein